MSKDISQIRKSYERAELSEDASHADPMAQFEQWFNEALHSEVLEPNAMTVATVGADGRPSSRIVLIKDFDARGIVWYTNYLSRKGQELAEHARLLADSITALTFQFEREFLRLRHTLDRVQLGTDAQAIDDLMLRFDILVSRKNLLQDNPSIQLLKPRTEYARLIPVLDDWLSKADALLQKQPLDLPALMALGTDMDRLGPDVQALSLASTSVISGLIENKQTTIVEQNDSILWLTTAQLLLLLVTTVALWFWHHRQMQANAALQVLNAELRQDTRQAEEANAGNHHHH